MKRPGIFRENIDDMLDLIEKLGICMNNYGVGTHPYMDLFSISATATDILNSMVKTELEKLEKFCESEKNKNNK